MNCEIMSGRQIERQKIGISNGRISALAIKNNDRRIADNITHIIKVTRTSVHVKQL